MYNIYVSSWNGMYEGRHVQLTNRFQIWRGGVDVVYLTVLESELLVLHRNS